MKHCLDLVKFSAKHNKKQDRMIRLCIVLSVFLVTVIFGMAEMEMRAQLIQAEKTDGGYHAAFQMDKREAAFLEMRPEVDAMASYGSVNYHLEDGYTIDGTETCVLGFEKELLSMFPAADITEGDFPKTAEEAVINEIAKRRLHVQVGDRISLKTPQGEERTYRISGFTSNTALMAEHDAFGMFLCAEEFEKLYTEETDAAGEVLYFVKFRPFCNISRAIREIKEQFGLEDSQVQENVKVLALMFQSRDSYMMQFYFVAAVLAVLVSAAGVLMITASMNSSVAKRTEFFGMLRCLGATGKQVRRFVRKEALGWCKTGIFAGILLGSSLVWVLCGMLRYLSPGLFSELPVFGVSFLGIAAGIVVGLLTVLLAAKSPAKRAAKVSPLTAVSGNADRARGMKKAADTRFFKIDTALGIHHAWGSRKNLFLVSGSFAFSIILFLAFSTAIDFMHRAINPLRPSAPDIYFYTKDVSNAISKGLAEELADAEGVKCAFGRSFAKGVVKAHGQEREITLLSYDSRQFLWGEDSLLRGKIEDVQNGEGMLLVYQEGSVLLDREKVTVSIQGQDREVLLSGVIGNIPYDSSTQEMAICSEQMFEEITGEEGYAVLDLQLFSDAKDSDVEQIRQAAEKVLGESIGFSDKRIGNRETKGASLSMAVFLYGFLAVIALIGFFNMINCIAMSVSSRLKEYGAMRAVGMGMGQFVRMVSGEAAVYALFGSLFGCGIGIPLNRKLFLSLVTFRWGEPWEVPLWELSVILGVMIFSIFLSVLGPAKEIKRMDVLKLS